MKNSYKTAFLGTLLILALIGIVFYLTGTKAQSSYTKKEESKVIKILFAGDLMFDRYIREISQKKGNDYILEEIKPILITADVVIVNLESPITNFASKSIYSKAGSPVNYIFTADPSVAETLFSHNIKSVNLGNNHILNFGVAGLEQTEDYLEKANVNYFGTEKKPYEILDFDGYKVGVVGYNQFSQKYEEVTLEAIKQLKDQVNFIVVYTHWGEEYVPFANTNIQTTAHSFIDQGADLIIGSHPHVIQQKEIYKNKTIYYSLGNFVMDQYFKENVRNGLMVKLEIDTSKNSVFFEEIPIEMSTIGQTKLK